MQSLKFSFEEGVAPAAVFTSGLRSLAGRVGVWSTLHMPLYWTVLEIYTVHWHWHQYADLTHGCLNTVKNLATEMKTLVYGEV